MLIRLLRDYLRPYRGWLLATLVLQLAGTLASLYLPSLNARIVDGGIARGDTGVILTLGGWMLLVSLAQIACAVGATYYGSRLAMGMGCDLRAALFQRVSELSARELARFGAPSLITRNTNDVLQVQTVVAMTSTVMVAAPIMGAGGIIMAAREDLGLSWLMGISVPLLALAVGLIVWRMVPQFRLMQQRLDVINRVLREQLAGIRVVRAFVREPLEAQRFATANAELTDTALAAGRLMALIFPLMMLILNASSVAVMWFGALRVEHAQMQVGALTAYLVYLAQILISVMMATFMLIMLPRAAVSAERIAAVLDTVSSVAPPAHPVRTLPSQVHVTLRDVSFQYPGAAEPVLRKLSLSVGPGRTLGLIGSTGAGKTTLVSLIPRLLDVTGGAVLIGGVDVRELDMELLWSRVGLVPQRAYLFSGTVASNLRYGNPQASDEELWQALEVAQARDFVAAMPGQLEAPITQGGTNVSGGQRQRLAIARALVRKPEIYLFDEAFSALDLGTDARLRAALRPVTREAAVILVAQRVATIRDADQIAVLDGGTLAGLGRHHELMASCPPYAEIVRSQLPEEEEAA